MIDLSTDNPGRFRFSNGDVSATPREEVADGEDDRSSSHWPGFSTSHGLDVVLPYTGLPGETAICVEEAGGSGGAPSESLGCFAFEQNATAFLDAEVKQGDQLSVGMRNVGIDGDVSINFLGQGGYFLMPWSLETWRVAAGPDGAADIAIDTSMFPPGTYTLAFHCVPECPGGTLQADRLVGGGSLNGPITLASDVTIQPTSTATVQAVGSSVNTLHVTGEGFDPGQELRLMVIPNLQFADGPPLEASMVSYPVVDSLGRFVADVDLSGFPTSGATQVAVYNDAERPLVTAEFEP
jgi:hypothetical protein